MVATRKPADYTCQLPEETQRDAAVDVHANFKEIHPSLQRPIVSLRTAVIIDDWKLDKQQTSHDDVLDSFRLALCNYELPNHGA